MTATPTPQDVLLAAAAWAYGLPAAVLLSVALTGLLALRRAAR